MTNQYLVTINRAEKQLHYRVAVVSPDGRISGALNPEEYPWHWGFEKIEHAIGVAEAFEAFRDSEHEGDCALPQDVAKTFSDLERAATVPTPKAIAVAFKDWDSSFEDWDS